MPRSSNRQMCKFESCDNPARYPILGVCSTCYSGLRLWVSRTKAQKNTRMRQYKRMEERMETLLSPTPGPLPGYRKRKGGR